MIARKRRLPYTYVLLRYVHDPIAGERLNVGVLLHCPARAFARLAVRAEVGRISDAFPDLDAAALAATLRRLSGAVDGKVASAARDAGGAARLALPEDDSSLVWSAMGGGLTDDPRVELDRLYRRMVSSCTRPR